ncbi:MAG: diguanylate cyclase [Clostridia bacterium]
MKHKVITRILYIFIAILAITTTIISFVSYSSSNSAVIDNEDVIDFSKGWYYESEDGIQNLTIPKNIIHKNGIVKLYNKIPDCIGERCVFYYLSKDQNITVEIDGKVIYEYGKDYKAAYGANLGKVCNIVTISKADIGKTIAVTIENIHKTDEINITKSLLGTKSSIVFYIIGHNMISLVSSIVMIIGGIIFALIGLIMSNKDVQHSFKMYTYFGIFIFLSGLWILSDSNILQFFVYSRAGQFCLSNACLMLMPIPISLFMRYICTHFVKIYDITAIIFGCNFIVVTFVYITMIVDAILFLRVLHILIIATIALTITTLSIETFKYHNGEARNIFIGIIALCSLSLIGIIVYYLSLSSLYMLIFIIGALIFTTMLLIVIIRHSVLSINTKVEVALYKRLAFTDLLTHIGNRAAYKQTIDDISHNIDSFSTLSIVVADLNKLKSINDTYGHLEGDNQLFNIADCLQRAFSPIGISFRTGGDEFAVIIKNSTYDNVLGCIEKFHQYIEDLNLKGKSPFSVSTGFAIRYPHDEDIPDIFALYNRADSDMYINKQRLNR